MKCCVCGLHLLGREGLTGHQKVGGGFYVQMQTDGRVCWGEERTSWPWHISVMVQAKIGGSQTPGRRWAQEGSLPSYIPRLAGQQYERRPYHMIHHDIDNYYVLGGKQSFREVIFDRQLQRKRSNCR